MSAPTPPWTRLIRFIAAEDHVTYTGQPTDANLDVGLAYAERKPIRVRLLGPTPGHTTALDSDARLTNEERTVLVLLPPLDQSQVGSIRALGANYVQPGQDAREAREKRPPIPILFYKPATALSGPERDIIIPKAATRNGDETDYEVELGVILGKSCLNASPSEAKEAVLAYTLTNDVSYRKRMFAVPQWGLGKSFDGSLPIGPCLVHRDVFGDPDMGGEGVRLRTEVNGEEVQNGSTTDHLWRVMETIAELSQVSRFAR